MRGLTADFGRLIFPRYCSVCNARLLGSERFICTSCLMDLPRTGYKGKKNNMTERLLWQQIPQLAAASAFLRYEPGTASASIFMGFKYSGKQALAHFMGTLMAAELKGTGFFDGINLIVPIPLSRQRLKHRGYNQSECLAAGVAEHTGLPLVTDIVTRTVDNPTQTNLNTEERQSNVAGIFHLERPEAVAGRHVLIVDDVLTTGATVASCANEIATAGEVKISVLTLGLAGKHYASLLPEDEVLLKQSICL